MRGDLAARKRARAAALLPAIAALAFDGSAQESPPSAVPAAPVQQAWIFEQGGVPVGWSWWDDAGAVPGVEPPVRRFTGGWKITQASALGSMELRASGEMVVDGDGHPLRGRFLGEAAGTTNRLDFEVDRGTDGATASGTRARGPTVTPFRTPVAPDAFTLVNNWIGLLDLAVRRLPLLDPATPRDATLRLPMFHPESGSTLSYELRRLSDYVVERDEKVFRGPKWRDSLGEVLRIAEDGGIFEIEIPAQGFRIRRATEPVERFEVAAPPLVQHDFAHEEVTIARDGFSLAGTITRRKDAEGRQPGLFFVSGSGGQDREGLSGGIDIGTHELLDHLTEAGFTVLRVDDRGVGKSGGALPGSTYEELVADARACVDFLAARPEVDPERLFVIGHSEGGATAPIIACERKLRGIVLMAPPGRNLLDIMKEQKRHGLEASGLPSQLIESELEVHRKFLELVAGDQPIDPDSVRADYRAALVDLPWMRSHAHHDPIAQARQVKCPVLIVQGGKDVQVSAERDAPPLLAALKESGNPDATLVLFPELDHLFKKVLSDPPSTADYLKARPLDPDFLAAVTKWLQTH